MADASISRATLGRAPMYLRYVRSLPAETDNISATTIAKALELGEVQVRKDLKMLCGAGRPKTGYPVSKLIHSLEASLDSTNGETIIIGAGKLGRALLDYAGFGEYGLNILAAFDIALNEPETSPKGKPILPTADMSSYCAMHKAKIGIIAVPSQNAQQACEALCSCGVKTMLCLAPCKIVPPLGVVVRYENIAQSLAVLKLSIQSERLRTEGEANAV